MSDRLTSTIAICTKDRIRDLTKCLEAVAKQTRRPDEILIVDSSEPPVREASVFKRTFSERNFRNSRLRYLQSEPGLTRQRNLARRAAEGEIVIFLDDDTVPFPDFIEEIMTAFLTSPDVFGAMGSIQGIPRRPLVRFLQRVFMLTHNYGSGKFMPSGLPSFPHGNEAQQETEVLSGAVMALRSRLLEDFSFDEKLDGYGYMEDVDFSRRISRHHKLLFIPSAKLYHDWSPPRGEESFAKSRMFVRNHGYLFFKNFYRGNPLQLFFFIWSLLGYFLLHFMRRDVRAMVGVIAGAYGVANAWWKEEERGQ